MMSFGLIALSTISDEQTALYALFFLAFIFLIALAAVVITSNKSEDDASATDGTADCNNNSDNNNNKAVKEKPKSTSWNIATKSLTKNRPKNL